MQLSEYSKWTLEVDGNDNVLRELSDVRATVARLRERHEGKLNLTSVIGLRPWWARLIGAKYHVDHFFALEWTGEFAALIFFDCSVSEYRALDKAMPVVPPQAARENISHGEPDISPEECMKTSRAFDAIDQFLESGQRPNWMDYRYVR